MDSTPLARLLAVSPRGTASEIARRAHVSPSRVSDYASGRRRGRPEEAFRVASAAGMTLAQFYGTEPYEPPAPSAAASES